MRLPCSSSTPEAVPGRAANRNVEPAKPRLMISTAFASESSSRSRPVIPACRVPEPT